MFALALALILLVTTAYYIDKLIIWIKTDPTEALTQTIIFIITVTITISLLYLLAVITTALLIDKV